MRIRIKRRSVLNPSLMGERAGNPSIKNQEERRFNLKSNSDFQDRRKQKGLREKR